MEVPTDLIDKIKIHTQHGSTRYSKQRHRRDVGNCRSEVVRLFQD